MANTIKHKRGSGSDPSASDLEVGELAIRTDTGAVFTKKDDDSVTEIAGSSSVDKISEGNTEAEVVDTGSDGHFKVTTEGTERLRIDSSGNVGIGSTSPAAHLEIKAADAGTTGFPTLWLNRPASANSTSDIALEANAVIRSESSIKSVVNASGLFSWNIGGSDNKAGTDGSSEVMRIDSSGRLLIGTTTARTISSQTIPLQIEGSASGTGRFAIGNDNSGNASGPVIYFFRSRGGSLNSNTIVQDADSLGSIIFNGADGVDIDSRGAEISAQVDGTPGSNDMPGRLVFSTTADGASEPTERLRIDSSGKVYFGNFDDVANTGFIDKATTGDKELNIVASRSTAQNRNIVFKGRSDTEAMRIDSSGNVGIGTTNPVQLLHLSSSGPRILLTQTSANSNAFLDAATSGVLEFSADDNDVAASSSIRFKVDGSESMRIDSAGQVGIGTTSPLSGCKLTVAGNGLAITGQNGAHSANSLRLGEEGSGLAQFRAYGPDASTSGQFSFVCSESDGGGSGEAMRIGSGGSITLGYAGNSLYFQNAFNNSTSRISNAGSSNNANLRFLVRNAGTESEAMRLDSSGRLGIGTSSPSQLLDVNGNCTISSLGDITGRTFTSSDQVISNRSGTSNCFVAQSSGSNKAVIKADGSITTAGTLSIPSPYVFNVDSDQVAIAETNLTVKRKQGSTDSAIRVTRFNGSSAANMVDITADGDINAEGAIQSGGNPVNGGNAGTRMGPGGSFDASATAAGTEVYRAFTAGNSTPTVTITAGGVVKPQSIEFPDGSVQTTAAGKVAYLVDKKSAGTDGGTSVSGINDRVLNTKEFDTGSFVTLAANRFTLPAGKYMIEFSSPARKSNAMQTLLINHSTNATIAYGQNGWGSASAVGISAGVAYIDIASNNEYKIQTYIAAARTTDGLGEANGNGDEIYTTVKITSL